MKVEKPASTDLTHWWEKNSFFDLDEKTKRAKPKPGLEEIYELTWAGSVTVAWTYELVRRLPYFKNSRNAVTTEEMSLLKALPPFNRLSEKQRYMLQQTLMPRQAVRLVRGRSVRLEGYSNPLPSPSFDLTQMSNNAITEWIERWIEKERRFFNQPQKSGAKGRLSRNPVQDFKKGRWDWVEQLEPLSNRARPLTPNESRRRERVRASAGRHALRHFRDVLTAMALASVLKLIGPPPLIRPDKDFSKKTRTPEEVSEALRRLAQAKAKKAIL